MKFCCSLVYVVFITTFFNHITNAVMFDIAHIGPDNHNKDIVTEGVGTYISTDGIQLASHSPDQDVQSQDIVGRAIYAKPLHLWDNDTDQLADFTTSFTFTIRSDGAADNGDGLSFFLAQNSSLVTASGAMGLPVAVNKHMMASSPFVAVEFASYWNKDWDPVDSSDLPIRGHVGININSLLSSKTAKWDNFTFSKECHVKVKYESASQNLSVTFIDYHNNTIITNRFELHQTVDLRKEVSEWVIFGFCASSSKSNYQKNSVKSWSFKSSELYADQIRWIKDGKKRKKRRVIRHAAISLIVMLIAACVCVCVYFWKKKRHHDHVNQTVHKKSKVTFESNDLPQAFPFKEMLRATNNFREENKLGQGGFGAVYKGVLQNGRPVAVKKVSTTSKQGIKEYKAEVEIISKARHRNLVQLIGWCHEREGELLVVYELMENRSLDGHLFNSTTSLPWNVRYNIARGLAMALHYMHKECAKCILHRDIKSSNVMLDSKFNPKLGDFGLAKLVDHDKSPDTTIPAGTPGYLAPECVSVGKVSQQSDVYSYGVVALEIATGRKPFDVDAQGNQTCLIDWAKELYRMDRILEAVDPKLGNDQYHKNQMEGLITLGLWCVYRKPDERPSIDQVLRVLNNEDDPLSELPEQMPSLVDHDTPLPYQSLESINQVSRTFSASSAPYPNESNAVPTPNVLVALGSGWNSFAASLSGLKSMLQDLWRLLDIE